MSQMLHSNSNMYLSLSIYAELFDPHTHKGGATIGTRGGHAPPHSFKF